nr:pentatricopeptide repeat-containing protein At1g60770 [Ipomoea batatas]
MASFIQRFSSKTKNIGKRSTKKFLEEALYRKLVKEGGRENSVGKNLNEFLKSHKSAYKWEVGRSVKLLRQRKLYSPAIKFFICALVFSTATFEIFSDDDMLAINTHTHTHFKRLAPLDSKGRVFNAIIQLLEVFWDPLSETMEKRGVNKTTSDQGIHVDLVAKSKGIAAAEAYFINLPETSKNHFTYGALLNCYCKELMTEKAEALIEKMKELNLTLTSMPYNSLMTLYTRTGQPEKIPAIIQEMKECDIMPDSFTYNIWMRALAALHDISGVERVIDEMKRDGRVAEDWTTYSNLASIYADAGLSDKAEKALKELEKKNTPRNLTAYQFLITLYGRIGNLLEVYRIWRSLRLAFPKTANISYLNMIQVLVNLNDMPGAEKCFKEWESGQTTYDIRRAMFLIFVYIIITPNEKFITLDPVPSLRAGDVKAKTWSYKLKSTLNNVRLRFDFYCCWRCTTKVIQGGLISFDSTNITTSYLIDTEKRKSVELYTGKVEICKGCLQNAGKLSFIPGLTVYHGPAKKLHSMLAYLVMKKVLLELACAVLVPVVYINT